jgi:hypothetical protein
MHDRSPKLLETRDAAASWSTVQTQLPALLRDVQGLLPQRP